MSEEIAAQLELNRLIHASARYLDDHDFQAYLDLYREEGVYSIVTRAPELPEPMVWMQRDRTELDERIAAMSEQEWEIAEVEQTRVVSVDLVEVNGQAANTSSSFALYHTGEEGLTSCYAVGRYDDCWGKDRETWKLLSRRVVLKTRQLGMLSPLPI
ncbi:MAG: nuclear transport factor 2 family protein [Gammaproteobacteria bacterium]|nr:nuclear transport factor 2 family protein [Gammaproteobacteria bacterium]MDE0285409.1 nuclear transport factor 2 family protein [Gammaproteobacteria bacterium]MDE0512026.1 nuclear transport factor 2 family protein [Gammaproteobacteria bacterium]